MITYQLINQNRLVLKQPMKEELKEIMAHAVLDWIVYKMGVWFITT